MSLADHVHVEVRGQECCKVLALDTRGHVEQFMLIDYGIARQTRNSTSDWIEPPTSPSPSPPIVVYDVATRVAKLITTTKYRREE